MSASETRKEAVALADKINQNGGLKKRNGKERQRPVAHPDVLVSGSSPETRQLRAIQENQIRERRSW